MTPLRYDGSNSQPELPGLNVFNYSRADFAVDDGVYHPVRDLRVDDFLWDLK